MIFLKFKTSVLIFHSRKIWKISYDLVSFSKQLAIFELPIFKKFH